MTNNKQFWNKKAKIYDKMFSLYKPYEQMYEFIKGSLEQNMRVLEVGTGPGLIARKISAYVQEIEATDFSEEMIAEAKRIEHSGNINFSCADIFDLPFDDNQFYVVVAANILHIIPEPEKAMSEIRRVLKPKGLLIAPTYLWKELSLLGKVQKFIMMRRNFPLQTEWSEQSYKEFINKNGFSIVKSQKIKASFAIACITAKLK